MGVFETLAAICSPEDLASIRESMRDFLSAAGAGPKTNRGRLLSIAEHLYPFERRYLPELNVLLVQDVPCRSLVCYVRPGSRLTLLVAAVLGPRRVFVLETPGSEASIGVLAGTVEPEGIEVITIPYRGESGERTWDRLFERLRREDAIEELAFFPGEGPSNEVVGLTAYAQRRGFPVLWAEAETYAGIERPFSIKVHQFGLGTTPKSSPARSLGNAASDRDGHRDQRAPSAPHPPAAETRSAAPEPAVEERSRATRENQPAPAAAPPPPPEPAGAAAATEGGAAGAEILVTLLLQSFNGRNYPAALRLGWHVAQYPGALNYLWISADLLDELIRVYADWDRMAHSPVQDTPKRRLHDRLVSVWQQLGPARGRIVGDRALSRNAAFLRTLQSTWRPGGRIIGEPARVVDRLRAGVRARARGQFSEAAGHYQRAMELAALLVLDADRFELGDPLEPDYTRLTELVGNFGDLADRVTKVLRAWGLNESMPPREAPIPSLAVLMALLEGVGENVREGPALAIGSRFRELMTRARSGEASLAASLRPSEAIAGTSPLDAEPCERIEKAATEIASRAVGADTFRQLTAAATHPQLTLPTED